MLKLSDWGDTEGKTEKGAVRSAASLNVVTGVSALKIFIGEMGERTDRRQSQSLVEVKMNCFKVMGNTCKSMADSFQCMTNPTTIKKK